MDSIKVGELIQESGYLLSYNSDYLRRKNWIQICLMGECAKQKLVSLLNALNRACFSRQQIASAVAKQP
jgi:predicted DNA-binding protein (MmcQ/YjbR family)